MERRANNCVNYCTEKRASNYIYCLAIIGVSPGNECVAEQEIISHQNP